MNYNQQELEQLGLKNIGKNVSLSKSCVLINPQNITIDDNSRIDVFSIISAGKDGIEIGKNVHIAPGTYIFGGGGRVVISDFAGISSKCSIYTSTDDYVMGYLTNPTIPDIFKKMTSGSIIINKHCIVGSGSIILPNVTLGIGSAVGSLTLIRKDVLDYNIVSGNPIKKIGERNKDLLLKLELEYLKYAQGMK